MKKAIALNEGESEFWLECIRCNTFVNTYKPQAHQEAFHRDAHKFKGNFGGYGSGKTLTSRQELYKHVFLTPGGNTIIGANVQSQYEQTIKREIEADIPKAFIKGVSTQKQYIDFINGHRVMFRPFDDVNKLRSYNVDMFIILEASEVKAEAFTQLKTRLRNLASTIPERDADGNIIYKEAKNGVRIPVVKYNWAKGIIESNPDAGWIKSDVLMVSDDIQKHGIIHDTYAVIDEEKDPAISSHVTSTSANEFLPPGFIENNKKNKPSWWINRYIYGSFMYSEGLVYPNAMRQVCETFEVPKHWKRIVAYDYGLSDDSVYLFGAVDEQANLLYIYKEVRINNRSVEELAKIFHQETKDIPVGGWITSPIIDPKSGPRRDYDKKTLSDHFLDYGIAFKPGHINVDARIFRLNTYLESGRIRIMDCCTGLIKEIRDYKFQVKESEQSGWSNKPEDKNNHGINALEWIVMELPADPKNLVYGIYNKRGRDLTLEDSNQELTEEELQRRFAKFIFSEDEDSNANEDSVFDIVDYNY
jgi:phage terminase large subunit